jgi:hypothetical protein
MILEKMTTESLLFSPQGKLKLRLPLIVIFTSQKHRPSVMAHTYDASTQEAERQEYHQL